MHEGRFVRSAPDKDRGGSAHSPCRYATASPHFRMLRSQRILIVVGLVIIAWLLHVTTCDWAVYRTMEYWNTQRMSSSRIVVGWETAATVGTTPPPNQAMPG